VLAAGAALGPQAAGVVLIKCSRTFSDEKANRAAGAPSHAARSAAPCYAARAAAVAARKPAATGAIPHLEPGRIIDAPSRRRPPWVEGDPAAVTRPWGLSVVSHRLSTSPAASRSMNCSRAQGPLLFAWGIRDPGSMPVGRARRLQRHALPPPPRVWCLEAAHCPHDEVPDQCEPAPAGWLAKLELWLRDRDTACRCSTRHALSPPGKYEGSTQRRTCSGFVPERGGLLSEAGALWP